MIVTNLTLGFHTMQQLFSVVTLCFFLVSPLWCFSSSSLTARQELRNRKTIKPHLNKINKTPQKSIQSPDGDIIDCVLFHLQPAFDHPLSSQIQRDPKDWPKGYSSDAGGSRNLQLWTAAGEQCPNGTIPIRRSKKEDLLRVSSLDRFGKKKFVIRETSGSGHEHAVAYASGDKYYGARASLNVWSPRVANNKDFSISQLWLISGSFGDDLNTIEAGWQVSPELYGDSLPRFFTYWTTDAYQITGCYNLLCSGFVQTNSKIAVGAAISPTSSFNGGQFDISILIWKDPKHGNWWLEFGSGTLVGYWPAYLFTHLKDHASMVQFGGEVYDSHVSGEHTATQMGSGHFAGEGFGKASYFRNLQYVDWDNSLVPVSDIKLLADHPVCYDVRGGSNRVWGNYFYYGGPGRNPHCK